MRYVQRRAGELSALPEEFVHRSTGPIDGHVCVRTGTRIGIRDGEISKWLSTEHPLLLFFPVRRIQRKWRVRVADLRENPAPYYGC